MRISKIIFLSLTWIFLAHFVKPVQSSASAAALPETQTLGTSTPESAWSTEPDPLQIPLMRERSYTASPITIEQTLAPGSNYTRSVVSYLSDGYKIYALMTIPDGTKPSDGWPVIVFNHGYIAPSEYRTTERYLSYVDRIAQNGYIVFKSDYRGHGNSEGGEEVGGGYGTPDYTVDILNAIESLKEHADVNPNRIGIWGHSMGGQIALRAMVVSSDIKAGVIWAGVVAPYPTIIEAWNRSDEARTFAENGNRWVQSFSSWAQAFLNKYGSSDQNPDFWGTISPNNYLEDLSGPIQLHHSTTDARVPYTWSEILAGGLQKVKKWPYSFYAYPDDDHNISTNFETAMQRTITFFDQNVKRN